MKFKNPSEAGRRGALARFERHKSERVCRPDAGTPLRTITIEDHISGCSKRIVVRQAARKNQVVSECFGAMGGPVGWDRIMRRIRKYCVVRWLEV
jgi:hypothetical protein